MATPSALVEAVAESFRLPVPTVAQLERNLVKAKIRTPGPRGRNSYVTPTDAANLIIAAAGALAFNVPVKDSAHTVIGYGSLPAVDAMTLKLAHWPNFMPQLPPGHTFSQALAHLISGISAQRFDDPRKIWPDAKNELKDDHFDFDVSITSPFRVAKIEIGINAKTADGNFKHDHESCSYFQLTNEDAETLDLSISCEFRNHTLRSIASIFQKPEVS